MSIIVDTEYTINIADKQGELYEAIVYSNSFSAEAAGSVPTGWTVSPGTTNPDPRINVSKNDPNLKVLAISGSATSAGSIDGFPGNTGYGRWVKYSDATVAGPVRVQFKFMAGSQRTGNNSPPVNEFDLEKPEAGEYLYFQYSKDDSNWTTIEFYDNGAEDIYTNIFTQADHLIEAPANKRVYLRWVTEIGAGAGHQEFDNWGIKDVIISKALPVPKRLTFLGAPNIRKQTASQRYYTFLGKQQI